MERRSFIAGMLTTAGMGAVWAYDPFNITGHVLDPLTSSELEDRIEASFDVDVIGVYDEADIERTYHALVEARDGWDNFEEQMACCGSIKVSEEWHAARLRDRDLTARVEDQSTIFFRSSYDAATVVHELAHLWHFTNVDDSFDDRWRDVADFSYGVRVSKPSGEGWQWNLEGWDHRDGVMTAYGATSLEQDVAEFCEATYRAKHEGLGKYSSDERYAKKLNLLEGYGFISSDERDYMNAYFG